MTIIVIITKGHTERDGRNEKKQSYFKMVTTQRILKQNSCFFNVRKIVFVYDNTILFYPFIYMALGKHNTV